VVRAAGIAIGVAAIVSGWWYARCWVLYGTPMPHSLYDPVLKHGLIELLVYPLASLKLLWLCFASFYCYFWTPFGLVWKYVTWTYYFWPIAGLNVVVLIGLVPRARRGGVDWRSLGLLVFAAVLTYAMWLRYSLTVDNMARLQGRLFLPVAAVVGMLFVLGADGWLASARAKRVGVVLWLILMVAANAAVLWCDHAFFALGG
jgi:hypothetical protein